MTKGTGSRTAILIAGAVGGVALDVLSLYFTGFPEGHTFSWYLGKFIVILLFMALTGFLAWVYSNGQLKTAFVIGVAAPSILLNIAASVQKPRDAVPLLPSIPANSSLEVPVRWSLLGPAPAEAQERSSIQRPIGQLKVAIRQAPAGVDVLKDGELLIFDSGGRLVGKTVPPSQTFLFALPSGTYKLQYRTPQLQSAATPVTIDAHRVTEIDLPVQPLTAGSSSGMEWNDFLRGAESQLGKIKR